MNRAMGGKRAGNYEFRYRVHATSMDSRQGAGALCSVRESVTGRTECVRRARSGLWGEGLRQGKPWERGCDELKLFTASQQVRHLPGRGPAGQPGARVAWRAATYVVKRTQRVVKRRYGASKSQSSTPSSSSQRGQHRERRYRRGAGGSAGVGERAHSHGMARRGTWETLHGPRAKAGTRTTGRNKGSGPAPLPAGERERTSRRGVVPAGESISRREAVQGVVAPA